MSGPTETPPPFVAIVTGANSGVGFGICQRLLLQMSQKIPSDSLFNLSSGPRVSQGDDSHSSCPLRPLRLLMACRNLEKAEAAKKRLLEWFHGILKTVPGDEAIKRDLGVFRNQLEVDVALLDLANVQSTFQFCEGVLARYSYVTHLFLNAAVMYIIGIDTGAAIHQLLTEITVANSVPKYGIERVGDVTEDGLGHSWQSNVYGHYIMVRQLDNLLKQSPIQPTRVIWLTSRGAAPNLYDPDDWQLLRSTQPYFASKRQIDVISWHLNQQSSMSELAPEPRHIAIEPGVVLTNITPGSHVQAVIKFILFHFCRLIGSPIFTISPYKAAVAATYAALAPVANIPDTTGPFKHSSKTNRWGKEGVMSFEISGLDQTWAEDMALIEKCEQLYQRHLRQRILREGPSNE